MPMGAISSSKDTVGVAVLNYKVPACETRQDVLENSQKIAQITWGANHGFPGLDLIAVPDDSTQGFHATKRTDLRTTIDRSNVEAFSNPCADNEVWGSRHLLRGQPPGDPPRHGEERHGAGGPLSGRYIPAAGEAARRRTGSRWPLRPGGAVGGSWCR
jgi:hypothetical protein